MKKSYKVYALFRESLNNVGLPGLMGGILFVKRLV